MEFNIDKAAVERAVADAIVGSAIGDKMKKAVNELLAKQWDNPIDKGVAAVIAEVSLQVIRDEYAGKVREAVRAKLEEETVEKFVGQFWDKLFESR